MPDLTGFRVPDPKPFKDKNSFIYLLHMIMAAASMLGYVKQVLSKVTFDLVLFEKELRKSIRLLIDEEIPQLKLWCLTTFTTRPLRLVVERCFHFVEGAV